MIKIKVLMTGTALTGALLMSASVAKANAYMELISGSTTVQVEPGGVVVGNGSYTTDYALQSGNGALFIGTIGSWGVDIASGAESGSLSVTLVDNINGDTTQTHGLEILFSSGSYALSGSYNFGVSDSGGNSLIAAVSGWTSSSLYTGSGSKGTSLGSWTLGATYAQSFQNTNIALSGSQYVTEELLFGGTTGTITPQQATMNATASFTTYVPPPVTDGGLTAGRAGAALLCVMGLRSKFGVKRS